MPSQPGSGQIPISPELLEPILELRPPESQTPMGRTLGEGLALPRASELAAKALSPDKAARYFANAGQWTRQILNKEWIPENLDSRFIAVAGGASGADAVIAAWTARDHRLQVVVTESRFHLMVSPLSPQRIQAAAAHKSYALGVAEAVLSDVSAVRQGEWIVRPFGGLSLGHREIPFARQWPETLVFLTDGRGVKLSAMKYRDRVSPIQQESASEEPKQWFSGQ